VEKGLDRRGLLGDRVVEGQDGPDHGDAHRTIAQVFNLAVWRSIREGAASVRAQHP
jgi:hypothetical protein